MAGGVAAGQYAHMELVLKAEEEARRESKELDVVAKAISSSGDTRAIPGGPKVWSVFVLNVMEATLLHPPVFFSHGPLPPSWCLHVFSVDA